MENMGNLGKMGRDKVTGFEGIITAQAKHLYGCDSYFLTPKAKEGKRNSDEAGWFDIGRIEIIGEGVHAPDVQSQDGKTGAGDLSAPATNHG